ncbi:hypothetical protein [Microcoleus sp. B9-D4]
MKYLRMPIDGLHHISYTIHLTANAKKKRGDELRTQQRTYVIA